MCLSSSSYTGSANTHKSIALAQLLEIPWWQQSAPVNLGILFSASNITSPWCWPQARASSTVLLHHSLGQDKPADVFAA